MNEIEKDTLKDLKKESEDAQKRFADRAFAIAEKYRKYGKGDIVTYSGFTYVVEEWDSACSNWGDPEPTTRYMIYRVNKKTFKKTNRSNVDRVDERWLTLVKKADVI